MIQPIDPNSFPSAMLIRGYANEFVYRYDKYNEVVLALRTILVC